LDVVIPSLTSSSHEIDFLLKTFANQFLASPLESNFFTISLTFLCLICWCFLSFL